jgi:cell division septal protein FtsQ
VCEVARPARKDLLGLAAALTIAVLGLVGLLAVVLYLLSLPFVDWLS